MSQKVQIVMVLTIFNIHLYIRTPLIPYSRVSQKFSHVKVVSFLGHPVETYGISITRRHPVESRLLSVYVRVFSR